MSSMVEALFVQFRAYVLTLFYRIDCIFFFFFQSKCRKILAPSIIIRVAVIEDKIFKREQLSRIKKNMFISETHVRVIFIFCKLELT